jgi:hypothetical protein
MKPICVMILSATLLWTVGCGEEKVDPSTLPEAELVSRVKQRPRTGVRPTAEVLTFRLGHLDRFNWQGKMLRAHLIVGDTAPEWSLEGIEDPGDEVVIEVEIAKNPKGNKIVLAPVWGPSKYGRLTEENRIIFGIGEESGKTVALPGSDGEYISNILVTFAPPGRPQAFNPDEGLDLFVVKTRDTQPVTMRLRVFASSGISGP